MSINRNLFSTDWFSGNIPQWNKQKNLYDQLPGKRCLEIGSFEGRSTIYLAENYCNGIDSIVDSVDTWGGSIEHDNILKLGLLDRFKNNVGPYIESGRVIMNQGNSKEVLLKFVQEVRNGEREKYDFVYIDGSHIARDVLSDAILSWEVLNIGGLIYFDDYQWRGFQKKILNPKVAIDSFLSVYEGAYKMLFKEYQLHIQKIYEYPENIDVTGEL